ncbi:D-arabinono-1,4-lactone oxidase [Rhodotorula kratochvilovae]
MAPLPTPDAPSLAHHSTAELRSLLAPCTIVAGSALTFTNWATTFRSRTAAVFRATTVEQVRWAVELARREGRELRAAGAGHSPSDIVCTSGYLLDLRGLNRVLDVDSAAQTFHAEGGIILNALHPVLAAKGQLALPSLGSISDQTLAGAISTSTHGSGVSFPSLSTGATFLDLVLPLPDAPVVRVSRAADQDPDLFHAALCGLGAVGIVVGVGMRAERVFRLEEECFSMRFDEFTRRWQEIAESAEHVRCWWFPQVGRVKVSRLNRTTKPATPRPTALSLWYSDIFLAKRVHALALFAARYAPSLLPYHAWFMWTFVHQPGPFAWGAFVRGLWSRLSGRVTSADPWPRVEELDALGKEADREEAAARAAVKEERERAAAKEGEERAASPSPPPPFASLDTETASTPSGKLALPLARPADLLTPPYTPTVLSPSGSPTRLAHNAPEQAHAGADANEEAPARKALPWPILEDEPTYRVDESVAIFNYDCGFPQYTYESCVPYASTGAALYALNEWHTRELATPGYPLRAHFPVEIRWTDKDEGWLSPTGGGRGCYLGAIQYRPFNLPVPYRSHFSRFASLLSTRFSARPHWAKSHGLMPADLEGLYPRFGDFLAVRARVDPEGMLANSYVRRHLLGEVEKGEMEREGRRWKARP